MVRQGHIIAPDVELPLPQTEHPAQHVPRVNAYPHIDVEAGGLADESMQRYASEIALPYFHVRISLAFSPSRVSH